MYTNNEKLKAELAAIRDAGLYKDERVIVSKQSAEIEVSSGSQVLNFCANNYLGLSDDQRLIDAAVDTMRTHGFGMSSVRFICGTQDIHKALESAVSEFLQTDDTILYTSCFDANGGLFETLLGKEDAIISDALNHASIIDGVRLSKAYAAPPGAAGGATVSLDFVKIDDWDGSDQAHSELVGPRSPLRRTLVICPIHLLP